MIISYLSYLAFYKESSLKFLLYINNNAEKFAKQISRMNQDVDLKSMLLFSKYKVFYCCYNFLNFRHFFN